MSVFVDLIDTDFRGDIAEDRKTLDAFSRDASLFSVSPSLVVFPRDVADLKTLVAGAVAAKKKGERVTLTARAAGTDMSGGPLSEGVIVSFTKYFTRMRAGDGVATAEPGVYYRDFEKETLKRGYIMPSYPASRELAAIGGIVANNSGGEKSLTYGKTERYVKQVKAVLADGEEHVFEKIPLTEAWQKTHGGSFEASIYRGVLELIQNNRAMIEAARPKVSKNSAGYALWNVIDEKAQTCDLTKLFVGSQGTLGLISEATFTLVHPYEHSRMLVMFLKDTAVLGELIPTVLEYKPESFESYDDHTFEIAVRYFTDVARRLKGTMLELALRFLPEFWKVLTNGVPKMVLIAEFTAVSDEEAEAKALSALHGIKRFNLPARITRTQEESEKYWVIRRESFNLLRHHIHGKRTAPFIDDIVVSPNHLPAFLPKLEAILEQYDITYTIAGHVGDGNFHIIPLMDLSKPEAVRVIQELSEKVYKLVLSYKGSITGEHNDGLIRTPYLKQMYGEEIVRLFEEVKNIFDPQGIFNPGKKVKGSLSYAISHIQRS